MCACSVVSWLGKPVQCVNVVWRVVFRNNPMGNFDCYRRRRRTTTTTRNGVLSPRVGSTSADFIQHNFKYNDNDTITNYDMTKIIKIIINCKLIIIVVILSLRVLELAHRCTTRGTGAVCVHEAQDTEQTPSTGLRHPSFNHCRI